MSKSLDLDYLRKINLERCNRWHENGINDWSLSDWGVAAGGEMGEVLDVIKKLNRERDGLVGNRLTKEQLQIELGFEIADTILYLDLLAARAGINLSKVIKQKFNNVSIKNDFPEFL